MTSVELKEALRLSKGLIYVPVNNENYVISYIIFIVKDVYDNNKAIITYYTNGANPSGLENIIVNTDEIYLSTDKLKNYKNSDWINSLEIDLSIVEKKLNNYGILH
jgi:hypothetical protein